MWQTIKVFSQNVKLFLTIKVMLYIKSEFIFIALAIDLIGDDNIVLSYLKLLLVSRKNRHTSSPTNSKQIYKFK